MALILSILDEILETIKRPRTGSKATGDFEEESA